MAIRKETVTHYAKLAQLHFSEEETEMMCRQLGDILDYVKKISQLEGDDCPLEEESTVPREDILGESLSPEEALANAPDRESNHFLVPRVIAARD